MEAADPCATRDLADRALVLMVVLQEAALLWLAMAALLAQLLILELVWMRMASTNISFICAGFLTERLSRKYQNFSYLLTLLQYELSSIGMIFDLFTRKSFSRENRPAGEADVAFYSHADAQSRSHLLYSKVIKV